MYHVPQALYGHARQLLPAPTDWASYVLHDSLHFHYLSNLTGEQRSHAVDFAFEMLQAHPVFLIAARRRREESEAIIESASQPGQLGIVALWEGKIFGLAVFRRRSAYGRPVTILESYSSEFHAQLKRREDQLAELADLGPDLELDHLYFNTVLPSCDLDLRTYLEEVSMRRFLYEACAHFRNLDIHVFCHDGTNHMVQLERHHFAVRGTAPGRPSHNVITGVKGLMPIVTLLGISALTLHEQFGTWTDARAGVAIPHQIKTPFTPRVLFIPADPLLQHGPGYI